MNDAERKSLKNLQELAELQAKVTGILSMRVNALESLLISSGVLKKEDIIAESDKIGIEFAKQASQNFTNNEIKGFGNIKIADLKKK